MLARICAGRDTIHAVRKMSDGCSVGSCSFQRLNVTATSEWVYFAWSDQARAFQARVSGVSFPLKWRRCIKTHAICWPNLLRGLISIHACPWTLKRSTEPRRPGRIQGEPAAEWSEQPCAVVLAASHAACDGSGEDPRCCRVVFAAESSRADRTGFPFVPLVV